MYWRSLNEKVRIFLKYQYILEWMRYPSIHCPNECIILQILKLTLWLDSGLVFYPQWSCPRPPAVLGRGTAFPLPCLNLIQPYLQSLCSNLSPPATRNKNWAHPFLLLSQEAWREKGQHGHCFQIYVTGTHICLTFWEQRQAWNFYKGFFF